LFFFFSSWQPLRQEKFFWYGDPNQTTSVEESLINLTNKWICFSVKKGDPSLIPQNCDEKHPILCEDTNGGKIFYESCLLRNKFTKSKEKSSTTKNAKTISK